MVYHGPVSKGCQRCRQRKVRCDQRRPSCMRCEKLGTPCPGFRDLNDVVFRDERARIVTNAHKAYRNSVSNSSASPSNVACSITGSSITKMPIALTTAPSPPVTDAGANFFFTNYTCDQPPLSPTYHKWLIKMYTDAAGNDPLKAALEAAGMAGIANRYYAPDVCALSKKRYCRALAATNQALQNPMASMNDSTLAAIIMLGLYEFVTAEGLSDHRPWTIHLEGATALLRLRGSEQFQNERGGQLFLQFRSQLLYSCLHQGVEPPKTLSEISKSFDASPLGSKRQSSNPPKLGGLCFRLVALRDAVKKGDIVGDENILKAARMLENDLSEWSKAITPTWEYLTLAAGDDQSDLYFQNTYHVYANLTIAQAWNSWRSLRILLNNLILETKTKLGIPVDDTTALIRELSVNICTSAFSFRGTPRAATLIWPLSVVSEEEVNPALTREWASNHLRWIDTEWKKQHQTQSLGFAEMFAGKTMRSGMLNGLIDFYLLFGPGQEESVTARLHSLFDGASKLYFALLRQS